MTFLRVWGSYSRPAAVSCDDGLVYVVKGLQAGGADMAKPITTEQIIAASGRLVGAPVVDTVLVDVADLVAIEPQLAHLQPGLTHGVRFIPDCSDRMWTDYAHIAENRPRFGAIAVMYSWVGASDHQVIYENQHPHLVYTVDHGHFLPGGTNWTVATLQAAPAATGVDPQFGAIGLVEAELRQPASLLRGLQPAEIAGAVALPPDAWGVTLQERVAIADYLERRRMQLGAHLPQ
jgi:hypothetical protein